MVDNASNEYPIGSMVLLYMVTWIPSTKKPVMLALIYQHHGSVMGTITPMFGVEVGSPASNALPEHFMGAETPIDDAGATGMPQGMLWELRWLRHFYLQKKVKNKGTPVVDGWLLDIYPSIAYTYPSIFGWWFGTWLL